MSEVAFLRLDTNDQVLPARLMGDGDLWREAIKEKDLLRAALERAVDPLREIGKGEAFSIEGVTVQKVYTADFSDRNNLHFYDQVYMPRLREVAGELKLRNMERQLGEVLTPEGLYAVKLGRTMRFNFNQLSGILFPQSKHVAGPAETPEFSNNILMFPGIFR